jgi:hypothetical protein
MTDGTRSDGSAGAGPPVTEGTIRQSPQHDEPIVFGDCHERPWRCRPDVVRFGIGVLDIRR